MCSSKEKNTSQARFSDGIFGCPMLPMFYIVKTHEPCLLSAFQLCFLGHVRLAEDMTDWWLTAPCDCDSSYGQVFHLLCRTGHSSWGNMSWSFRTMIGLCNEVFEAKEQPWKELNANLKLKSKNIYITHITYQNPAVHGQNKQTTWKEPESSFHAPRRLRYRLWQRARRIHVGPCNLTGQLRRFRFSPRK